MVYVEDDQGKKKVGIHGVDMQIDRAAVKRVLFSSGGGANITTDGDDDHHQGEQEEQQCLPLVDQDLRAGNLRHSRNGEAIFNQVLQSIRVRPGAVATRP
jgi:hypothetical protein